MEHSGLTPYFVCAYAGSCDCEISEPAVALLEANASIVKIGLGGANEMGDAARAQIAALCEVSVWGGGI